MNAEATERPIRLYEDFDSWQRQAYLQELRDAAQLLRGAATPDVQALGARLDDVLDEADAGAPAATFRALAEEVPRVQMLVGALKQTSDGKINAALNLQLNRNRSFLDEMARFIDGLQEAPPSDSDDGEDVETEDDEEESPTRTGRAAAHSAYMQAVRADARAHASNRVLTKTSRNGRIIEWLGSRTLPERDRAEVGTILQVQASARHFRNPVKRYIGGIPRRYRAFRRQ